jgi:hypothetical protein
MPNNLVQHFDLAQSLALMARLTTRPTLAFPTKAFRRLPFLSLLGGL